MHTIFESILLMLQFHAEGASGDGGDGGASTGVEGADVAGQHSLEDLGVPKDKAEKHRALKAKRGATQPASEPKQQVANAEAVTGGETDAWEEALKNPDINKRMQETVNARLKDYAKKNGDHGATLNALLPALELVGKKVGIDVKDLSTLDVSAFVKAVNDDPSYFEDLAAEMGTTTETARDVYNREREARNAENNARQMREEMQLRQHYDGLVRQSEEMKNLGYTEFDLQAELEDPWFARVTSPQGGLSIKQAYEAKYHDAIVQARVNATARSAQEAITNSIKSRSSMPRENGTTSRSTTPTTNVPYSEMNPQDRAAYYKKMTGRDYPHRR